MIDGITNFIVESLMDKAENRYKRLKESGNWKTPTEQEERIIALMAEIETLMKKNSSSAKKLKAGKKKAKKEEKKKKDKEDGQEEKFKVPAWKAVASKEGESTTKKVNSHTYHWCPKHEMWLCIHQPSTWVSPLASLRISLRTRLLLLLEVSPRARSQSKSSKVLQLSNPLVRSLMEDKDEE